MPLVRIALRAGKPRPWVAAIGDGIHRAMVETINAPADDRFQIVTEHAPETLVYPPEYMGSTHTDDIVIVQITLNQGRTVEQKKALYARIAELLSAAPGVRPEDVIVSLVEVTRENWSWGKGEATYVK